MTSQRPQQDKPARPRGRTGPRSAAGKARTSRNALRHGLAVPVLADATLSAEVDDLARRIADGDDRLLEAAVRVAEAQVDLRRIRQARAIAMRRALSDPNPIRSADLRRFFGLLARVAAAEVNGREPRVSAEELEWAAALGNDPPDERRAENPSRRDRRPREAGPLRTSGPVAPQVRHPGAGCGAARSRRDGAASGLNLTYRGDLVPVRDRWWGKTACARRAGDKLGIGAHSAPSENGAR